VNLGPLLDAIAPKVEELIDRLPPEAKAAHNSKWALSADQVRLIRVSDGKVESLATEFAVDKATISRIKSGQAYKWVE
jgi:hypothetical protein